MSGSSQSKHDRDRNRETHPKEVSEWPDWEAWAKEVIRRAAIVRPLPNSTKACVSAAENFSCPHLFCNSLEHMHQYYIHFSLADQAIAALQHWPNVRYTKLGIVNGEFMSSETGVVVMLSMTVCHRLNVLLQEHGLPYKFTAHPPMRPSDSQVGLAR